MLLMMVYVDKKEEEDDDNDSRTPVSFLLKAIFFLKIS